MHFNKSLLLNLAQSNRLKVRLTFFFSPSVLLHQIFLYKMLIFLFVCRGVTGKAVWMFGHSKDPYKHPGRSVSEHGRMVEDGGGGW